MTCRSLQSAGKEPETRGGICMKKKHYALRDNILLRIAGRILIVLIGVIQAVGTIFVGISAVVLKPVAVLMIAAAALLAILAQFPWKDALPVFAVAAVTFWLPEIAALLLVALTVIQGKIAGDL